MFRSAGLLLILGLAAGLWLGFNPQAHKQTVQDWDKGKEALVQVTSSATAQVLNIDSHTVTWFRANPKPQSTGPTTPSVSSTWKEITTSFEKFWSSLQTAWIHVVASVKGIRF